jgi:predicted deacylase
MKEHTRAGRSRGVKTHYTFLKLPTGSDLSRRRLPLMSAIGPQLGPVIWLTACSHGNEVGGIVVIQEVFKQLRRRLQCGIVYAFPLMNPLGFEAVSRHIIPSQEDLNRSFPGSPTGSLGERIAHRILSTILDTAPSLVLDLHNDWIRSIPYGVVDAKPGSLHSTVYDTTLSLASQLGLCLIADTEQLSRSLSYNLLVHDIPALTLELGESYVVNERNVACGVEAVWNMLSAFGMITPPEPPFHYPLPAAYSQGVLLGYADKPYSSHSGIIRFLAKPGEVLSAGQPFATVLNTFGKHLETVRVPTDSLVLGHSDSSAVFPGMPIMAFGIAPHQPVSTSFIHT